MARTHYEAETHGIVVRVLPAFREEDSSPEQHRYVWSYHIEIENRGHRTVQLQTRHWRITDREGRVQEVNGVGVVGKTPVLKPGDTFEYDSGAPLSAPSGVMQGAYRLSDENGEMLEVRIPMFTLDSPYDKRAAN